MIRYLAITEEYDVLGYEQHPDNKPKNEKEREIMYASHMDNYIYQYYGEVLNQNYNKWTKKNGIDDNSIAYRNNKKGKSNIDFSAEVIDQIIQYENCYIMIGDFASFFDTLDHQKLKDNVIEILGCQHLDERGLLAKDWYNVFTSITRYGYVEKELLERVAGSDRELRDKNQYTYFRDIKEYRKNRAKIQVKKNKKGYGIPQGTAISAILANIYAIDFDVNVKSIIDKYQGLYRRYSDDFIIIIPKKTKENKVTSIAFSKIIEEVYEITRKSKLNIQEEKTELYEYKQTCIRSLKEGQKTHIDYLGFIFNGFDVRMRDRSVQKFYRNASKLLSKAKISKEKNKQSGLPYQKDIYRLYTDRGAKRKPYGNFITYAQRSQRIFDQKSLKTNNLMMHQIRNRKRKIEKRMDRYKRNY